MTILRSLDDLVADQAEDAGCLAPTRKPRPMTLACRWSRDPDTGRLGCVWELVERPKLGPQELN